MRKSLKHYLLEQEVLQKLDALKDTEQSPEKESEMDNSEFDLKAQERLPQEGVPQGIYRRYLGWLTSLPAPKSPRYKRWVVDMVMRWLEIEDLSTLNRTERPIRSYITKQGREN